ncbi:MAG: type 1 glutamine amidotransferase [Gaiellaceae bacterium]
MRVLSVVHQPDAAAGLFEDVVRAQGHELDEWSIPDEPAPPLDHDAVLIFGGAMNVDEEAKHPWLRHEDEVIRSLLGDGVPLLGVCLGGQLLAKAAGAHVGPSPEPEHGFVRAWLTDAAAGDPLFGSLPLEFDVFEAHGYAFHVPEGAVELARSRVCSQAFRLGNRAWGVQFHPEIRVEQAAQWLREDLPANGDALIAELRARYAEWAAFGERLCVSFLQSAARTAASALTDGRSLSSSSHDETVGGSSTPSTSRSRSTHGA